MGGTAIIFWQSTLMNVPSVVFSHIKKLKLLKRGNDLCATQEHNQIINKFSKRAAKRNIVSTHNDNSKGKP
jgi:hypothetical protein